MDVKLEYQETIIDINSLLKKMPELIEKEEKAALRKIGAVMKKNVIKFTHDSDIEIRAKQIMPSNYDGSKPYVHTRDDISFTVRKDKNGTFYISVRGGKHTGYKWHLINDGHIARDGRTFVRGNNFIGRAVSASEGEIERIVNSVVKKVADS